jgi:hypothetical protein
MTVPSQGLEGPTKAGADVRVNALQMRVRMRALVEPLSSSIIVAADRISTGTTNRLARREALLWKLEGVPALREALFRPDPITALLDAWALTWQMTDYFESGPGMEALKGGAPIAVATCGFLERRIQEVSASMTYSGEVTHVRNQVKDWAKENPIRTSIASRESIVSRVTEVEIREAFKMSELVGNVAMTLDDLSRRIDIQTDQLLDQARWQAELLMLDWGIDHQLEMAGSLAENANRMIQEIGSRVEGLAPELESALNIARSAPEVMSAERTAAMKSAHDEISRTLEFVHLERIEALRHLSREREEALRELNQTIVNERTALAVDLARISARTVERATLRAAQLSAVVLLAVFAAAVVLLYLARRIFSTHQALPPTPRPSRPPP